MASRAYDDGENERAHELARRCGIEFVGLDSFRIPDALLKKVPIELIFRYNFVPLEETQDGKLAVAIADPRQLMMIDEIKFLLNREIVLKVATLKQISNALTRTEQAQRDEHR